MNATKTAQPSAGALAAVAALTAPNYIRHRVTIGKQDAHDKQSRPADRLSISMASEVAAAFAKANGLQDARSARVYLTPHTDAGTMQHGVILRVADSTVAGNVLRSITRTPTRFTVKFDGVALPTQIVNEVGPFATDEVDARITNSGGLFIPYVAAALRRPPRQLQITHRKRPTASVAATRAPVSDVTAGSYGERLEAALQAAKRMGMQVVSNADGSFTFKALD